MLIYIATDKWFFQLIFFIMRGFYISKASNLFFSYFLNVKVSNPCNATLENIVKITFFLILYTIFFKIARFSC